MHETKSLSSAYSSTWKFSIKFHQILYISDGLGHLRLTWINAYFTDTFANFTWWSLLFDRWNKYCDKHSPQREVRNSWSEIAIHLLYIRNSVSLWISRNLRPKKYTSFPVISWFRSTAFTTIRFHYFFVQCREYQSKGRRGRMVQSVTITE
jgi:hypothetical protein